MLSPGSAETNVWLGGKLNGHLMASCVRNICTKNYQNLIIGFQVTVKNVEDSFGTQCGSKQTSSLVHISLFRKVYCASSDVYFCRFVHTFSGAPLLTFLCADVCAVPV